MILDGHEEDPWAECVSASWFLSQGLLKFGLGDVQVFKSKQGHQRTKHPIDCLQTIPIDFDTSNA
jgi:hypothetical protein